MNAMTLSRRVGLIAAFAITWAFATTGTVQAHEPVELRRILIFGGSGQLGAEIAKELAGDGHYVHVFVRPSSDRSRLVGQPVEWVVGNVLVEEDVKRALQAQRYAIVINALGRSESGVEFYATSGRWIAKWAKATGVKQVVLHSSVGVGKSAAAYPADRLGAMRALFVAKESAERDVIESGITYTIIRNAVLRDLPAGARSSAKLYEDETKFGAVSRRGLAQLTAECIDSDVCANKIFHAVDEGMTF
jgi:uncharacterized protein YbjT (DUF2867 family)